MAKAGTALRWLWRFVAGTAATLAVIVAIVLVVAPRLDLADMRPRIEAAAAQALGRTLELRGPLSLKLSLPPAIEAAQIRLHNPPGWSGPDFARVDELSVTVSLIPLLGRRIVIDELKASGVELSLIATEVSGNNWTFGEERRHTGGDGWQFAAVNHAVLRKLALNFSDQTQRTDFELRIESLSAGLPVDAPMRFEMEAVAQAVPFTVDATAGSLNEVLTSDGPVPVEATLRFNEDRLRLAGSVTRPLQPKGIDISLGIDGRSVADTGAIFEVSLPDIGEYRVTGDIRGDLTRMTVSDLSARLGNTSVSGDLQLVNAGRRARIAGSLVADTLDLGPWLTPQDAPPDGRVARAPGPTATLLPEIDLQLRVDQFIGLPVEVTDASVVLTLQNNAMKAPLQASIDGVTVRGEIAVALASGEYAASAALQAQQVDVGDLLARHTGYTDLAGTVDSFSLEGKSRGAELRSLIEDLNASVRVQDAALAYGNEHGETPVAVDLDEILLETSSWRRATAVIAGRWLDEPFAAQLELGDLRAALENTNLPFEFQATGAGTDLTLSGRLSGRRSAHDTTLRVRLAGERFGELSPWLGVSAKADASYSLSGDLRVQSDRNAWGLRNFHARLGRSSIEGSIGRTGLDSRPLLQTSLAFDVIDPFELERLFAGDEAKDNKKTNGAVSLDLPILPKGLNLEDMDIDIRGERLIMEPADITDVSFSTRIRDGHVADAPFRGTLANTLFEGSLALDLRGEIPEIRLGVGAGNVNIGNFLRQMELANEIEASSRRFEANLVARGSSMSDLVADTEIFIETHSGIWLLSDPNQAGTVRIEVPHGTARASTRDKHTTVTLDARVNEVPLDFTLEATRLAKKPGALQLLDTRIRAAVAGAELTMQGLIPRLGGLRGLDMQVALSGSRFDGLNELLDVSLPPFGPYFMSGRLRVGDADYDLEDISMRVGETVANGRLKLSTAGDRPHLDWMLEARSIQLDDFRLGDWRPAATAGKGTDGENSGSPAADHAVPEVHAGSAKPLLSREVMRGFDGTVDIRVGEVVSGRDRLGFGEMRIELQDGKLALWLDVDLPGGEAALELGLQANEQDYAASLRSRVENFDYGVFARRIDPDTDMAGKFSLDVDLSSRGKDLSVIDDNANGHFDFAIWPETLRSGIFDLWTANLFFVVLPVLNLQTKSRVNCLVGRLDMEDGVMVPDPMFMDTTRTQVRAKGEINFRTRRVELRLTPRGKRPKFFSLSTPVVVSGSFDDFNVGLRAGDLFGTVVRMLATVVLVPGQYIIEGVRPDVDTKRCRQAIGVRDE